MFRNKGNTRTYQHNLKLAATLAFVAGLTNVAGFLAVRQLTTNVTGHFAFFIGDIYGFNWQEGMVYFLYIFSFFLGSFFSGLMVEMATRINVRWRYIISLFVEISLLTIVAIKGTEWALVEPHWVAFILLFSMGLQNSLVTTISNSIVRTTHLTGLFTDLGIELSQVIFYTDKEARGKLYKSMKLRLAIIFSFFLGGVVSGIFYRRTGMEILFLAVFILVLDLVYDSVKVRFRRARRRMKRHDGGF